MTSQTVTLTDLVGVSSSLTSLRTSKRSFSDVIGVTDTLVRHLVFVRSRSNTVGISNVITSHKGYVRMSADAVGITNTLVANVRFGPRPLFGTVGISNTVNVILVLVPFDTWRPVPRPDNALILLCRTPAGEHDTTTTHLNLWTIENDGSRGKREVGMNLGVPVSESWVSFHHPEWAPDGDEIVVASETSTEWSITVLDASGFGWL